MSQSPELGHQLFELMLRVRPGPGCEMPAHLVGADVPCYVAAPDHLAALRLAVEALKKHRYIFQDLVGEKVRQLDPTKWDDHIVSMWEDLSEKFPDQSEELLMHFPDREGINRLLQTGGVFFGPFCCWEKQP